MEEDWEGIDRRSTLSSGVCSKHTLWTGEFKRHTDRLIRIEEDYMGVKELLNTISNRQIDYIAELQYVKDAVDNGLKKDITQTAKGVERIEGRIETFCGEVNKRLLPLEEFSWFRVWMTDVRNNMFKNAVKWAFFAVIVLTVLHFSQRIIDKIFS
jgi:hypothetical protein